MSVNYLNNIGYVEVKNNDIKKEFMNLLELLCGESMEDHFYKVDLPKGCCCNLNNPEYILIIPDKYKYILYALGVICALMHSGSFTDAYEEERKTADVFNGLFRNRTFYKVERKRT